jgi:hypothetical protein
MAVLRIVLNNGANTIPNQLVNLSTRQLALRAS